MRRQRGARSGPAVAIRVNSYDRQLPVFLETGFSASHHKRHTRKQRQNGTSLLQNARGHFSLFFDDIVASPSKIDRRDQDPRFLSIDRDVPVF